MKSLKSKIAQMVLFVIMSMAIYTSVQQLNSEAAFCSGFPCTGGEMCGTRCYCAGGMCRSTIDE